MWVNHMWREKFSVALAGFSVLVLLILSACATSTPPVSHVDPVTDYASLVENLRAAGATVEPVGSIIQLFLSVKGNTISVNGENMQVFEYAEEVAAKAEAAAISPDRSSVGISIVSWAGPPHFFQTGRIIVLNVGSNQEVIELLEEAIGLQIAGR